jgi:hypothetical protein
MSTDNNVSGAQSVSYMISQTVLNDLDSLNKLADSLLAAQKGPIQKFLAEQQQQDKDLARLTQKLAAARIPQNMQQLASLKTKIETVLPKLQMLGKADDQIKMTTMMGKVDDMKRKIAGQHAMNSGPGPIDTGLI